MKLAVSNIAWDPADDATVAHLLVRQGVHGIEIAPTKWRDKPFDVPFEEVAAFRDGWEERGLPIVAMQALLFGRPELQLFGDASQRAVLFDYLCRIIDFGAFVGATALVFGSPKNRVRGDRSLPDAMNYAADFFRQIGEHAHPQNVAFCIEANPAEYGCDFITTTAEAIELCRLVDHPAIRVNGDLGGITLSHEDTVATIAGAAPWLGHFHASEPHLAELGASADHELAGKALYDARYSGWISIEMRGAGVEAVERAVRLATRAYGGWGEGR